MTSDYRVKYINAIVAGNNNNNTPDSLIYNNDTKLGIESFEGGIHTNNSRIIFILLAATIIILYILEDSHQPTIKNLT